MNVAVVTVSDSTVAGARQDLSGPAVAAICEQAGWTVSTRAVVPDEQPRIEALLVELCQSHDLVLTTGGTGVAERDVTPEATRAVLHKELPGLAELMRAEGVKKTRRAALSRALAGTRGRALLVNLPGSPKGAAESLNAILDLVGHVVALLAGDTAH